MKARKEAFKKHNNFTCKKSVDRAKRSLSRFQNETSDSPESIRESPRLPKVNTKDSYQSSKPQLYKIPSSKESSYYRRTNPRSNSYYSVGAMKRPSNMPSSYNSGNDSANYGSSNSLNKSFKAKRNPYYEDENSYDSNRKLSIFIKFYRYCE